MSYQSEEDSLYDGEPIELYDIRIGSQRYLFTSSNETFTFESRDVESIHIKHSNVKSSDNKKKANLDITMPTSHPFIRMMITDPPDAVMTVRIMRRHAGDPQWITYWRGNGGVVKQGDPVSVLECHNLIISTTRAGLRVKYNNLCNHALYDPSSCRAQKQLHTHGKNVTSVAGKKVTITNLTSGVTNLNFASKYFVGGEFYTANGYRRFIEDQDGDVLTLDDMIPGMKAGDAVTLFAGCDRTMNQCEKKFSNLDNYGGFPTIPTKNPFSGDGIV